MACKRGKKANALLKPAIRIKCYRRKVIERLGDVLKNGSGS